MSTDSKLHRTRIALAAGTRRFLALAWRASLFLAGELRKLARSRPGRVLRRPLLVIGRDAAIAALLAVALLAAGSTCFVKVRPGTVAVRQVNWGSGSGIEPEDHPPGIYFSPRFLESWHHLDTRTRVVSFSWESEGGQNPILEVRTREGNSAQAAVTVPYRIAPGRGYRVVEDGIKLSWERRVKTTVEKVLLEELAQLGSDELANTDRRLEVCAAALDVLNEQLAAHHVEADGIYITGFYYPPTYEKKQQERQLESQTLKTDRVLARLKAKRLENDFAAQELDREVQELVAELERDFEAARVAMVERTIERQKLENEFLVQQLERERQELIAELTVGYQEAERSEYELPLQELELESRAAKQELARGVVDLVEELDRAFEQEKLAASVRLKEQRASNELAAQALAGEEQQLVASLDREIEVARLAHFDEVHALRREAKTSQERRRHEAELAHDRMLAEGTLALESAETLREGLRADALATPGGRLYLAREAANRLRFDKVVLNSNDPRVPSVLDLDQMIALLVGKEDAPE